MIKTYISEQLVLAVKDRLRNVRYQIRRSALREASRSNRVGPIGPLVARPVALAADAVCSEVEAVAAAFMPEHERPSSAFAFPQPISAYFSAEAIDARSFTPEIYYALTGLLRRFGVDAFFVSEQAIDEALTRLIDGRAAEFAALRASDDSAARRHAQIQLCAALAVEIAGARPIREIAPTCAGSFAPRHLCLSPNHYCALVIGLSIALASRGEASTNENLDLILDSADLAVDARFGKFSAVLKKGREPAPALACEFEAILDFLP